MLLSEARPCCLTSRNNEKCLLGVRGGGEGTSTAVPHPTSLRSSDSRPSSTILGVRGRKGEIPAGAGRGEGGTGGGILPRLGEEG